MAAMRISKPEGFKAAILSENKDVFLNTSEYGELRTIKYDGEEYVDIPIVITGYKGQDRERNVVQSGRRDQAQGLYKVTSLLNCDISDLGGKQPENGQRIKINKQEGGGGFFREFYVVSSVCEMGMLNVELGEIDE